jgi:hypothetical protein
MPINVVFIQYNAATTGAGSYKVPSDFLSLVSIEAIGGGANGGVATNAGGGGGGAYAKSTTVDTSAWIPGTTSLFYRVGRGGLSTGGLIATDSWFNATGVNSAPTLSTQGVVANRGTAGAANAAGGGGQIGTSVGTTLFSGGSGGGPGASGNLGGGGGAAGPGGNGGTGGAGSGTVSQGAGGGGGGARLTAAGTVGQVGQTAAGGAGGAGTGQTGGSGATSAAAANVTAPANGGGGGGGFATTNTAGGAGSSGGVGGAVWTSTHLWNGTTQIQSLSVDTAGPGGGSGGGATNGLGGNYGGGAGGVTTGQASQGANGIIVITYNAGAFPMTRLTNTGTLYLNAASDVTSKINEITVSTMRMDPNNFYANWFDEMNGVIDVVFNETSVASGTTYVIDLAGRGVVLGDLIMVFIGSNNGAGTVTVPSGWTPAENANGKAVIYKYADSTEVSGTVVAFINSSAAAIQGIVVMFRNAAYDATGGVGSGGTTSITAPSVNVTRGVAIVLAHYVTPIDTSNSYSAPDGLASNPSVGFTDLGGAGGGVTAPSSRLFYCPVPYPGATGAVTTAVSPGTSSGVGSLFSIIPTRSSMQVTNTGTVFVGQFIDESTVLIPVDPII